MSSPLFSVQAGCAVAFAPRKDPALVLKRLAALPKLAGVTPASQLEVRPSPEMVSSGIREIDALTGGLPRGCLSEIWGSASSGRTSVLLAALAAATRREEVCALVDATDALDAVSAAVAGVDLERLLWIRCGKTGVGPRASGVGPQISDSRPQISDLKSEVRRPKSEVRSLAQTCASLLIRLQSSIVGRQSAGKRLSALHLLPGKDKTWLTHAQLLDGLHIEGELLRSRMQRKPAQSVTTAFATNAVRIS